ncbi:recombination protein O N-terminal domain-containing protein [bacterium]|nr:recombination protein O N-terminal domain-containing protein [bacterium]
MSHEALEQSQARGLPALWVASFPINESDALLRFFAAQEGSLSIKARGILKASSKLAPFLQSGDELLIRSAAARSAQAAGAAHGALRVLTGLSVAHGHPVWRSGLDHSALWWWMLDCCCAASAAPLQNSEMFQLLVNLLRSEPAAAALPACACVFSLKLLAIHGLLPDFSSCAVDGHRLAPDEPAFLLPSGEGLIGRDVFNARYARSAAELPRIDAPRRLRWQRLLHGALLDYPAARVDAVDAALLIRLATQHIGDLSQQRLETAEFLARQWKLQDPVAPA